MNAALRLVPPLEPEPMPVQPKARPKLSAAQLGALVALEEGPMRKGQGVDKRTFLSLVKLAYCDMTHPGSKTAWVARMGSPGRGELANERARCAKLPASPRRELPAVRLRADPRQLSLF